MVRKAGGGGGGVKVKSTEAQTFEESLKRHYFLCVCRIANEKFIVFLLRINILSKTSWITFGRILSHWPEVNSGKGPGVVRKCRS